MNYIPYLVLVASCVLISWRYHTKSSQFSEYAVSKNQFGSFAIIATIVASFVGGGTILGLAGKSYNIGIGPAIGLLGFAVQIFLTGWLIAPKVAGTFSKSITVGDIIANAYGERARMVVAMGWCLFSVGIVTAQFAAMIQLLKDYCPMGINFCAVSLAIIVILYSTMGGISAVVRTDIIQFIFFGLAIPFATYFVLKEADGLQNVIQHAPQAYLDPFGNMSVMQVIELFMVFLVGDALIPPVVQRMLISKESKKISIAFRVSSMIIICLILCAAIMGISIFVIEPNLAPNKAIQYAIANIFPNIFKDIFIVGMISVLISSADSYLNSFSVTLVHDFFSKIFPMSEKQKLKYAEILTAIAGFTAIYFANTAVNIMDILVFAFKFWGPIVVIPLFFYMVHDIAISRFGFYMSSLASVVCLIIWRIFDLADKSGIEDLIPGMLVNGIAFGIFYLKERTKKS